ncbi:MAG TPA: methyltransferase domain-containing protein, partial [Solirubrobacteraceae bacterium]
MLDADAYAAARRTTINAHYTDPQTAREMWRAVTELGFTGGRVLEPGAGSGVFIGLAPPGAEVTGVELDPTTAAIARALYPHAGVRAESFASTRLPDGHFDLTIGNVPFADVVLHDPLHNGGRHSIHNHFILKSLALTRPGGVIAVLTSRYTLDAANPAARREMNELGELLGAVRLPTGAHRRSAGTDAVTDLLILRRRDPGTQSPAAVWERTADIAAEGGEIRINSYFLEHPENVLGVLEVGQGMYSAQTLHVRGDPDQVASQLSRALSRITERARGEDRTFTARPEVRAAPGEGERAVLEPGEELWDGHITAQPDGTFTTLIASVHEPLEVPHTARVEVRELLALRDSATRLLAAEASSIEDTGPLAELRIELHGRYTHYLARYGPISRFTLRATGRADPRTGEERMARITPRALTIVRHDPFGALIRALEVFDENTQTATPAKMLTERVLAPRAPVLGADSPSDALAICLDTHGRVDLEQIAALLGQQPEEARAALGELVFEDPQLGRLVPGAEYLAGNVREKLHAAREAAQTNPSLAVNGRALERVLPRDLGMDEVEPRLGAAWIDAHTHREFLTEILDDPTVKVEHPGGAIWGVRGNNRSVRATSDWGTERMPAPQIAKSVLEQRPIQVTDETDDGRRVVNATETTAAQEKAQALQERFAEWVWEDPERAARLIAEYNRRFNSLVLRDYTADGERLTLPGLARTFTPLPHQRTAVARILSEPAVGLFHAVGAGKTAEMV